MNKNIKIKERAEMIKKARKARFRNQTELAKCVGVTKATVSAWENPDQDNLITIKGNHLVKLAECLRLDAKTLAGFDETEMQPSGLDIDRVLTVFAGMEKGLADNSRKIKGTKKELYFRLLLELYPNATVDEVAEATRNFAETVESLD